MGQAKGASLPGKPRSHCTYAELMWHTSKLMVWRAVCRHICSRGVTIDNDLTTLAMSGHEVFSVW